MGRKQTTGLFKRGQVWHIEKQVLGHRIRESTGTKSLQEAEQYLARRCEEIRQATIYGVRPKRSFKEAAVRFLNENQHKASIDTDAILLKSICPFIGDLTLEQVHIGTLQSFIKAKQEAKLKTKSINNTLELVRHILNVAATEWIDENSLTWLLVAPKIKLLPVKDARAPLPLSWSEQSRLLEALPFHLNQMARFKVNTGCREQEVCQLRWEWEKHVPSLNTSVFIIPSHINRDGELRQLVKNGEDRLVILNDEAKAVIEEVRGIHSEFVFSYNGKPITRMNNTAWRNARKKANLCDLRVHDLKHTFGRRLRAAGVSYEDRQDLLGHRSGRITTHYSQAELSNLLEAANLIIQSRRESKELTILRVKQDGTHTIPTKSPQCEIRAVG
ncbi:TPA: site-specific integrase [Legionella pneumophila]|uniref:Site-specific integrase n=1 Tax=Legionella pneumophila TaxID=446 RepID=A0AAP3MD40_LEGPN|nr:site-specific integrase [Legionella pneumophila]HAT9300925.1 tyrosine-type recombinase/integrase [Legionella pneumophila subsp. pneumophila]MCO1452170.1 site-specific integrase [Legionella pneumophila]MCZ4692284.1 site-specific integrase [Legionella pneumophila]MCZ4711534.1 site-specific integrase [Legionella pneumophila]MCZ4719941.1 site-specific integrase [Legionella pneumophila]